MFYFSIESKSMLYANLHELAQNGVIYDREFHQKFMREFSEKEYSTTEEAQEACYFLEEMYMEGFFKVESYIPPTVYDALCFINKYFFFPPQCVWLNGKSYNISGNYGEEEYLSDKVVSPMNDKK